MCSKSLDGGLTFAPTGSPAFIDGQNSDPGVRGVPGLCDGVHGHGYVAPNGDVLLPRGWCGQPWLAISRDEGATWQRVQVAKNSMNTTDSGYPDHEAGVVADAKGNLYFTWVAKDRLPYLAISRDGGQTWGKPLMIAPPGVKEANLPGIDIGAAGKIAIVYMGSENSPGKPFPPDRYESVTWNGYVTMTTNALANDPIFYSASLNDPHEPLVKGRCGPFRCQAEYDFIDVNIGPDGTPWAVLVDGCLEGFECTDIGEGVIGHLTGGPRLR